MPTTDADFEVVNDREVKHIATGATWTTPHYVDVNDTGSSITENPGSAGDGDFPTAAELRPHAYDLLRRLAFEADRRQRSRRG